MNDDRSYTMFNADPDDEIRILMGLEDDRPQPTIWIGRLNILITWQQLAELQRLIPEYFRRVKYGKQVELPDGADCGEP